jgi:hypothetical protein
MTGGVLLFVLTGPNRLVATAAREADRSWKDSVSTSGHRDARRDASSWQAETVVLTGASSEADRLASTVVAWRPSAAESLKARLAGAMTLGHRPRAAETAAAMRLLWIPSTSCCNSDADATASEGGSRVCGAGAAALEAGTLAVWRVAGVGVELLAAAVVVALLVTGTAVAYGVVVVSMTADVGTVALVLALAAAMLGVATETVATGMLGVATGAAVATVLTFELATGWVLLATETGAAAPLEEAASWLRTGTMVVVTLLLASEVEEASGSSSTLVSSSSPSTTTPRRRTMPRMESAAPGMGFWRSST